MNAGMYGMADGRGMAGRKLAGQVYSGNKQANTSPTSAWAAAGIPGAFLSMGAGARTRLVSASGRGALRLFAVTQSISVIDTHRIEVWIDGKKIIDHTLSLDGAASQGFNVVGWASGAASAYAANADFVPFDSSCELYLTCTTGGASSARVSYQIDLHE